MQKTRKRAAKDVNRNRQNIQKRAVFFVYQKNPRKLFKKFCLAVIQTFFFVVVANAASSTFPIFINQLNYLEKGSFVVEYGQRDETNAKTVLRILDEACTEINDDLNREITPRIRVILTTSQAHYNSLTENSVPSWAQGVAVSSMGHTIIVLKSPKWNDSARDFKGIVVHELAHAILAEAVKFKYVPRWFDEGLAVYYSHEQRWVSTASVSKAMLTKSLVALEDIENLNDFSEQKAQLAYQESHLAIRYLFEQYGVDAIRSLINGLAEDREIDEIFFSAIQLEFWEFENEWLDYLHKKYRWTFLADIQSYLWLGILLLTTCAFIFVQLRKKKTLRRWEEEEMPLDNEQSEKRA